jgi:exonuclease SbcD
MRLLHAADLHLDSPFRGLAQVSERVAARLREASWRMLDRLASEARRAGVDAVLLAGDTHDSADRSVRAQIRLRDALVGLARTGIPSYVVLGNHDPADGWALDLAQPGVHVFPPGRPEGCDVVAEGRRIGHVDGISYPTAVVRDNYALRLRRQDDAPASVALLHANVGGAATGHADYAPARLEDLTSSGHDYWALGHVHTRQVLRASTPAVVYPGNPQGRSMREPGVRGAYVVEVEDGRLAELSFVPLCDVVFERVGVEAAGATAGDLADLLLDRLAALRAQGEGEARVVRLEVEGEAHASVAQLLAVPERRRDLLAVLREEAEGRWAAGEALVWPEGVVDLSRRRRLDPPPGTLLADVLDLARAAAAADDAGAELRREARQALAPLFDHPALRALVPAADDAALAAWLAAAADRLARALGEEEGA